MSKVILEFTRGHGRYVKGDVAGFEPAQAVRLRPVTKPYDADAKKQVSKADELADREALLAARELEFEQRLKTAGVSPTPDTVPGVPPAQGNPAVVTAEGDGEDAGASTSEGDGKEGGEPPAQGKKASK